MGWELGRFFGAQGLDTRNCWGFWGWWSEKKGPGLKPRDSMRLIQGAEAPCSLRKKATAGVLREKGSGGWGGAVFIGILRARKTRSE